VDFPPAAPVPNSSHPLRWILLGCGALTLIGILAVAGFAGVFYLVYKGTDDTAKIGADYLRSSPELQQALGVEGFSVQRSWYGTNVRIVNDGGQASFVYKILGPQKGDATVWLTRKEGKWSAVGARVKLETGMQIKIDQPPKECHFGRN
jgi:hypothetical protein